MIDEMLLNVQSIEGDWVGPRLVGMEYLNVQKLFKIEMEKYQIVKKLGSGTFGNVEMAEDKKTGEIVAIKRLKKKYGTWEECLQLSEVKALRRMNHPNIVRLKEVIRVVNEAYFVFEYIEKDLYKLMTERREQGTSLKEPEIRYITRQLVEAIVYIHKQGFFHRDMKPENILVSPDLTIKIIDFGIAREIRSKPPYTEYISTRWYRAPELLFKFPTYSAAVDVFALGCIVAEMYLGRPLFQGSSEMDQISKIASILGSPGSAWPEGVKQAVKRGIGIPQYPQIPLSSVIQTCPSDALSFIGECLRWDPTKRLNASQLSAHPYLSRDKEHPHQLMMKKVSSMGGEKVSYKLEGGPAKQEAKVKSVSNPFDKDDEFDQLLNDFKNYQLGSPKQAAKQEEEQDWY